MRRDASFAFEGVGEVRELGEAGFGGDFGDGQIGGV
jgi:hypothetical protein